MQKAKASPSAVPHSARLLAGLSFSAIKHRNDERYEAIV